MCAYKQYIDVCFNADTAASNYHFVNTESSLFVLHRLDQCVGFNMFFSLQSSFFKVLYHSTTSVHPRYNAMVPNHWAKPGFVKAETLYKFVSLLYEK